MGVKRIIQYCEEHAQETLEEVDLVALAKEHGRIQLLVDSVGFEIFLMDKFHMSLHADKKSSMHYSAIGGEYALLSQYVERFIKAFDEANIELIWMFDGAKGSSASALEVRYDTWIKRQIHRVKVVKSILHAYKRGKEGLENFNLDSNDNWKDEITPRLFKVEYRELLRKLYNPENAEQAVRGEIVQCVYDEADVDIAKRFDRDSQDKSKPIKPFAVLSNNSDFALFKNCRLIPVRTFGQAHFDLDDDLKLLKADSKNDISLTKLRCTMLSAERLRAHLQLKNYNEVADFAFACGCNFSNHLFVRLNDSSDSKLSFSLFQADKDKLVESCARFVREHGDITKVPEIEKVMEKNSAIRIAIEGCRKYFNLSGDDEDHSGEHQSEEDVKISENTQTFLYPPELVGIYNRFFWKTVNLEDIISKNGIQLISVLLVPLRKILYRLVSPSGDSKSVVEIGLESNLRVEKTEQMPASQSDFYFDSLPSFCSVVVDDTQSNLDYFVSVLTHMENSERLTPKYFKSCPTKKMGLTCYLLRYFLMLQKNRKLVVSETQFYALCLSMLATKFKDGRKRPDVDLIWYSKLVTIPDVRCLTMMEWAQELYWQAAYLFSAVFCVGEVCPQPSELFSGSLFSAFYTASESKTVPRQKSRIENYDSVIGRIMEDQSRLFKKYEPVIKIIVNSDPDFACAYPLIFDLPSNATTSQLQSSK